MTSSDQPIRGVSEVALAGHVEAVARHPDFEIATTIGLSMGQYQDFCEVRQQGMFSLLRNR